MTCSPADPIAWTPDFGLKCLRCDAHYEPGFEFLGCSACVQGPLAGSYGPAKLDSLSDLAKGALALREQRLPIPRTALTALGHSNSPLIPIEAEGRSLLLKLESQNPTGSHKDRLHALCSALAHQGGFTGLVASSTGNHGLACAAFAARVGLKAVIVADPRMPKALRTQIVGHGAELVEDRNPRQVISELTDDGWFPATSLDPMLSGRSNPFGADAYRAIAYEIVAELGQVPTSVAVPVASGDTLYGIWAGFDDIEKSLGLPPPTILACQPASIAPLANLTEGLTHPSQDIGKGNTVAISAGDRQTGRQAAYALLQKGRLTTVSEPEIGRWMRILAQMGFGVEPSSALSAAGLANHLDEGPAVAVITSSWANWAEVIVDILATRPST